MRTYDMTFGSMNTKDYAKPITALVMEPAGMDRETGVLLVSHGWGGNRRDYLDTLGHGARELGLLGLSVEFRGSGYDFDPVTGRGSVVPYDASHLQLFDVLGALRTVLDLYPAVDRRRIYHYGGSQGGHLALLSAIYAPRTFALVYATSPVVRLDPERAAWAGRAFLPWELSARDALEHAERIACPVILEHGTADPLVPCDTHTHALARRLADLGKVVTSTFIEGGDHGLAPVTTRFELFRRTMAAHGQTRRPEGANDFAAGATVEIPCAERTLRVDWSAPVNSVDLLKVR